MVAGCQLIAIVFCLFAYAGKFYSEPFSVLIVVILGFLPSSCIMVMDCWKLRKRIKERTGLLFYQLLYRNDREELIKVVEIEKFVDSVIKPIAENLSNEEIMGEIRVERADTTRNVLKQLETAYKKFNDNDLDGVYVVYQSIEKIFNRSPSLYFNMGNVNYIKGEFEAAAKCYRRGVECAQSKEFNKDEMIEKLGLLYYNLGNVYFHQKKYTRSIESYKKSIESNPGYDDALFNLAFCHAMDYEDTGNISEAVNAFHNIIEIMPENMHAWLNLGKCLFKMKKSDEAVDCYLRVVTEDTGSHEAWYWMAIAYDDLGRIEESVKAYYTAIQIKPDFIDAYNNLGVLLSTNGRNAESLKVFRNGLRIRPSDAELMYNIGLVLYESGNYSEALEEFLVVDKNRTNDEAALYMISLTLTKLKRQAEAMEYLERAVEINSLIKAKAVQEELFADLIQKQEYQNLFT